MNFNNKVFLITGGTGSFGKEFTKVILKESKWNVVNYQTASAVIKHVYDEYDEYLAKSRKHVKFSKDNFSLEKMDEVLLKSLNIIPVKKEPAVMPLNLPTLKKKTSDKPDIPKLKGLN